MWSGKVEGMKSKAVSTMRELRQTPVRDLTPDQCARLLVHHHGGSLSEDRRKAYLFKKTPNPETYFDPAEMQRIKLWIETEAKGAL
jgi:hypothetical protein